MKLGVAFDFDGVLFETYEAVAREARLLEGMLKLPQGVLALTESVAEALGAWDRRRVYRALGLPEWLYERLWAARVAGASGSWRLPIRLRGMGLRVYLVCGSDATVHDKLRRVESMGALTVFDDIVVYEPGGLRDALEALVEREGLRLLVYVDDKPVNTCIAASVERVKPLNLAYRPPLPHPHPWLEAPCAPRVALEELEEAILEALRLG